ncbi:hypothetical protein AVEN_247001-1 [Araneus ventricosus]|uniref:Uncharacterized protein n=1 Tax=Araneus ventricosus TaxID=182803 RepID=A0A4Y2T729_ARAVE|nr:hypothetical protein AVEN_247001-1 [Araneus ventricosus]
MKEFGSGWATSFQENRKSVHPNTTKQDSQATTARMGGTGQELHSSGKSYLRQHPNPPQKQRTSQATTCSHEGYRSGWSYILQENRPSVNTLTHHKNNRRYLDPPDVKMLKSAKYRLPNMSSTDRCRKHSASTNPDPLRSNHPPEYPPNLVDKFLFPLKNT